MKLRIPRLAMAVVKILRDEVDKPTKTGLRRTRRNSPGWSAAGHEMLRVCPMGLHTGTICRVPTSGYEFAGGRCENRQVVSFWKWWDKLDLRQARKAVDLIWPEEV